MSDKTKKILGIAGGIAVLICIAIMNSAVSAQHPMVHSVVEIVLQVLAGLGVATPISIMASKSSAPSLPESAADKAASGK